MKKFFAVIALIALQVSVADAQPRARRTADPAPVNNYNTTPVASSSSGSGGNITGYLGFESGAFNVGGEYEAKTSANQGLGGYLFFLTEKEDDNNNTVRNEAIVFGGFVKLHYAATDSFDLYAAPGFGIAMIDQNNDSETTIGPSFRLGAMYNINERFAIGWEHAFVYNWFNTKAPGQLQFGNVALRFAM